MHPGNFVPMTGESSIIAICLVLAIIIGAAIYAAVSE